MHDSCLHACVNVQPIPVCPPDEAAKPALTVQEVTAALEELVGREVRVRGPLNKADGRWTQINCSPGTCCSEQLDPGLALGNLRLEGSYVLADRRNDTVRCASQDGMMVQSLASSPEAGFSFERWDRAKRGDPQRQMLQRAFCCNLDGHGQQVLVSGTLTSTEDDLAAERLSNPFVCALP